MGALVYFPFFARAAGDILVIAPSQIDFGFIDAPSLNATSTTISADQFLFNNTFVPEIAYEVSFKPRCNGLSCTYDKDLCQYISLTPDESEDDTNIPFPHQGTDTAQGFLRQSFFDGITDGSDTWNIDFHLPGSDVEYGLLYGCTLSVDVLSADEEPPILMQNLLSPQTAFAQEVPLEHHELPITVAFKPSVTADYSSVAFLPGIEASRLYNDTTQLWEPHPGDDVTKLSMDLDGSSEDKNIHTKIGPSSCISVHVEIQR